MPEGYHHLTRDERCQIDLLKRNGELQATIAKAIGKSPSAISRELRRNRIRRTGSSHPIYEFKEAQRKALRRKREASCRPSKLTPNTKKVIVEKLIILPPVYLDTDLGYNTQSFSRRN